jgi:multidrug efflux pump subunit AcrA (membrane-fusion protein)
MKRFFLSLLMTTTVLIGGLLLGACGNPHKQVQEEWVPVRVENRAITLHEIGILEAKELARIQNLVDGNISEIAEDGTRVKKGQLILRLDDEELRNDLDNEILNLQQVREDLENELTEYGVLTNSFEMTSKLKKAELAHARLELKDGMISLNPEERRLREIDIALAKLDLEDKRSQSLREEELVNKGFAPVSSLEKIRREVDAAQTFLAEKETQMILASMPLPDEERLTLETAVKNADDALQRNQQKQNRDLEIQDLKIEGLKLKISHTQDGIDLIKKRLDIVDLHAPTSGILRLNQNWQWSSSWIPLSAGQRVRGLEMIGSIVDPDDLSLRVITHESDFLRLRVGQRVQARLTAFPDRQFTGKITSLTELGQDRNDLSPIYRQAPAIHQALFLVMVSLEQLGGQAMPGMTAATTIELEPAKERLLIPPEALNEDPDGKFRVDLRRDGDLQKAVAIEGDYTAEGWFEVRRGIQKGDKVLVKRSTK